MRPLAEETRALFSGFYGLWSGRGTRPAEQERVEQLRLIGRVREPAAVPALLGLLSMDDEQVADMAAGTIQQIVDGCDPLTLAQLDGVVREVSEYRRPSLDARDVVRRARGLTGVLGILSFHGSGYVREVAVRALADAGDGQELAFLLIRLNDWVRPVREAARQAVAWRIRPDYAAHFARWLPLVDRLRHQRREDHRRVLEMVLDLLRGEEGRPALLETMRTGDRHARRLAFRLLAEGANENGFNLLHDALASDDTVIRLWAARALRERLQGPPLRDVLERMGRDRFMPVRRDALYGFVEKLPEMAPAVLRAAMLDPHPSMREAARFYLRKSEGEDFASFYRDRLVNAETGQLAACVAGLGETGKPPDARRVLPFVAHRTSRVRREAVRATGRLDGENSVELMLAALQGPSPRVAKAARDVLGPRSHLISPERLLSILGAAEDGHVRRLVLSLTADLRWWDSAPLLVIASGDENETIRERAVEYLHRWRRNAHRLSVRPSREQLKLLEGAVERHGTGLDQPLREDLLSVLSYARRELL